MGFSAVFFSEALLWLIMGVERSGEKREETREKLLEILGKIHGSIDDLLEVEDLENIEERLSIHCSSRSFFPDEVEG